MSEVQIQIDLMTERLGHMEGFRVKKMFGGASLYSKEVVFCMITSAGIPHFRVGPGNIEDYKNAGQSAFAPMMKKGRGQMPYYTIPKEVMSDQNQLEEWAGKAVMAAQLAKKK